MKEVSEAVGIFMVHTIGPVSLAVVVGVFLYCKKIKSGDSHK